MNFDQDKLGLDFVQHRNKYFMVSGAIIGLGILILLFMGLNLGVDFESGTSLEVLIENQSFTAGEVREIVSGTGHIPGDITTAGNQNEYAMILFQDMLNPQQIKEIELALSRNMELSILRLMNPLFHQWLPEN
ncbi:hypothetical protein [Caldalkalibacillus mannanilyticus]|uniref:hypothetical protein n=1 Tax=Caldalkalibacillus mannanilyticus TaxID=1418 RepID=UPI000A8E3A57|nr:hypothetical protein [Caldalkalibacillus mannanilyticus]